MTSGVDTVLTLMCDIDTTTSTENVTWHNTHLIHVQKT